jgi:hypothetical protein
MHPLRTGMTSAALAALTLSLVVVAAPAASAEPSPAELCSLATAATVGKLQSSGALEGLEVQGIPAKDIPPGLAAQAARTKLNCASVPKVDPAKAKAAVCAQLTVAGLRAFASRLGADAAAQGKITEVRVAKARKALECDKVGATPTPTSTATPTGSATPTATKDPKPTGSSSASSSTTTQPRGTTTTTKPGTPGGSYQVDLDCKDFPTQAAAQKVLDSDRKDPHNLDRDNDGLACELGGGTGTGTGTGAGGNGAGDSGDYIGTGGYGQVGDDVPVGSIATGGR